MDFSTFTKNVQEIIPPGTILKNPGGGTTLFKSYSSGTLNYKRGKSTFPVSLKNLFETYSHFQGRKVSSSDLRKYKPSVFDSKAGPAGHACNCTVLFMILMQLGVIENIMGQDKRGSPYFVVIPKD
jgi:hypothetical protein